jgi:hypothetical protein
MRLLSESALDELSALAARDPRRLFDLFDRQRTMIAVGTADFIRPSIQHHIQHVLPRNKGFLVHARVLSFRPLRTGNRKNSGARGQRIAGTILSARSRLTNAGSTRARRAGPWQRLLHGPRPGSPSRLRCAVVVHLTSGGGSVPAHADDICAEST